MAKKENDEWYTKDKKCTVCLRPNCAFAVDQILLHSNWARAFCLHLKYWPTGKEGWGGQSFYSFVFWQGKAPDNQKQIKYLHLLQGKRHEQKYNLPALKFSDDNLIPEFLIGCGTRPTKKTVNNGTKNGTVECRCYIDVCCQTYSKIRLNGFCMNSYKINEIIPHFN